WNSGSTRSTPGSTTSAPAKGPPEVARARSVYRCTECGHDHPKWSGRCEACGEWNTVAEEPLVVTPAPKARAGRATAGAKRLGEVEADRLTRWTTGIPELDFVLGGGLVPGSMTLIGGEPGIGKSTLLLQAAARPAASGRTVLYASGEESAEQLRLRADRLGCTTGAAHVLVEPRLEAEL